MKKKSISAVLFVCFIAYLIYFISTHSEDFKSLLDVSPLAIGVIVACHLSSLYLNGLFVKVAVIPFKKEISIRESFFVSLLATIGNYFLPIGAGTGTKAVYLKRKIGLKYSDFLSILSGNYIIVFMFNAGLGLAALLLLNSKVAITDNPSLFLIFASIFSAMIYLAILGFPKFLTNRLDKISKFDKLTSFMASVLHGWNIISRNKRLLLDLVSITAINSVLVMIMTFTAAKSLGFSMGLFPLALYAALGSLGILLNLTPGSIGIKEAIFIYSSTALGLSISEIFSISIIVNGTLFFVLIISWFVFKVPYVRRKLIPESVESNSI